VKFLRSLFLQPRFFIALVALVLLFLLSYIFPVIQFAAVVISLLFVLLLVAEWSDLYGVQKGVFARRSMGDRLSNGDANEIRVYLENRYKRQVAFEVIDEIPHQFQRRDVLFHASLAPGEEQHIAYNLSPVNRGVYDFGKTHVYALGRFGFSSRRYSFEGAKQVPVYPSFLQMRKYELLALSNRLVMPGLKRVRRVGQNREFEQINNYVWGDDYRRINWKATARKAELMVNHYQDERSQQVFAVIDKGRNMQMPFDGLSLLDYAINASLALCNVALKKYDKAGLITFQEKPNTILKASSRTGQLVRIMEQLYAEQTDFKESDFGRLYLGISRQLNQRSLLLLFTNFETKHALDRQMKYLRLLNRRHLLVVVLFKNTELEAAQGEVAEDIEAVYQKGITEQLLFEKNLIAETLRANGIYTLLTAPQDLTPNSINAYLELKHRGIS
jgi:uncharacterized protein (DUF58 family)